MQQQKNIYEVVNIVWLCVCVVGRCLVYVAFKSANNEVELKKHLS